MKHLLPFTILLLTVISCNKHSEKADNLREAALKAIEAREFPSAIASAKEALHIYQNIPDTMGIIESDYLLARASALSGDFQNAVSYAQAGTEICKTVENYPLEYKLNNILSWAYFSLGKGLGETLEHQKRQLFVVDQLDDAKAKALVYNNYGYDATVSGTVPLKEAVDFMTFANDHYAKTEGNNGRWYTLMNLTWQYRLLNDLSKSEAHGRMAAKQAESENDRHAIIEANTNLGETLLLQNKTEEARPLYERGLELSLQENDRDKYVFDVYYSRYLWKTGEKEKAIALAVNAVEYLKSSEIFYEMLGRAFLAEYYLLQGSSGKAREQLNVFKNPRASYFSQEAKVIAGLVEARIMAKKDKSAAIDVINDLLDQVNNSGAELLKTQLEQLKSSYEGQQEP